MSEEEKAKEYIKEFRNEVFEGVGNKSIMAKNIDILLNLIDKQQKEIEDLKETNNDNTEKSLLNDIFIKKNYISKDKIREWLDRFELEEDLQDKYDELLGSEAIYKFFKKLLKEN